MMNYAFDYNQPETEIYFEWIIIENVSTENESDFDNGYNSFAYLKWGSAPVM